jgi:hypothetical protein
MNLQTLERDFHRAFGALGGDTTAPADGFMSFLADDVVAIDEDLPFVLDASSFREHLAWQMGGNWDSMDIITKNPKFNIHGDSSIISTYILIRGKPKDAGFRLRPCYCTVICAWDPQAQNWRGLSFHLSPLLSQIMSASPSA